MRSDFNVAWLIGMVSKYGGKLKEAWPHLEHAWEDLQKAVEIFNDGPLRMSGPLSPDAQRLLALVTDKGIGQEEAECFIRKLDEADKAVA